MFSQEHVEVLVKHTWSSPRLAMLILREGKPIRAVARDREARLMCNDLDFIVQLSAQSPMSHVWMDRLGLIKFRGIFKVVGADIVNVAPEVIDFPG